MYFVIPQIFYLALSFLKKKSLFTEENKVVEEQVDLEYILPRGSIRSSPSETDVHAEHQLGADRST